jgi:hypothetical protein
MKIIYRKELTMAAQIVTVHELTPAEYGKIRGMGKNAVIRRCEEGLISGAYKIGNRWKIPAANSEVVSIADYKALEFEYNKLLTLIESIHKLTATG